jgi:D-erythro-7,8-dihydroneopterin triphosphate epimerase
LYFRQQFFIDLQWQWPASRQSLSLNCTCIYFERRTIFVFLAFILNEPNNHTMAIIRIKNLLVRTIIGFNPEERVNRQDVIINLEIEVDVSLAISTDHPDEIYNYKAITKEIIAFVSESKFNLLEKLTHEVLQLVMQDERVMWAKIEIDKPHALRFSESVSVELEAKR